MGRRIIHDTDFIDYVMTPPVQEEYTKNDIKIDTVRVVDKNRCAGGLGELPVVSMSGGSQQDWITPVVVIVVSAMALMTLYAVLSKR